MLKFTNAQEKFVLANRRAFNEKQKLLGNSMIGNALHSMVGNALPVPKDVWGEWDKEAVELQRSVLKVFDSLSGQSKPMNIGKLIHHFQTVSDSGDVNITLDGRSQANRDQPVYEYHGTPLPIIDSVFSFGWRQMKAAETEGYSLEAAPRENSVRRVAEKLESIVLDGDDTIAVGDAKLYGLRTHPKRSTRETGVTLREANGFEWKAEVVAVLKALHAKNFKLGAKVLYLNYDDWFYASNTDFSAEYPNKTILQRIQEIAGVDEIVASDSINPNEIIALQKDRRVYEVLNGMPLNTRPKMRHELTDDYEFITMAAAALELKFDADGQMGLVHSAPAIGG